LASAKTDEKIGAIAIVLAFIVVPMLLGIIGSTASWVQERSRVEQDALANENRFDPID